MNIAKLLTFRACDLRLVAIAALLAGLSLDGCGSPNPIADANGGAGPGGDTSEDSGTTDDAQDADDVADAPESDVPDAADAEVQDDVGDSGPPADAPSEVSGTKDGGGDSDSVDAADIKKDTGPSYLDKICAKANKSCSLCSLCGDYPVCTIKAIGSTEFTTYPNDCFAICGLKADNWPAEVGGATGGKLWPKECPGCAACTPDDMKLTNDQYCVTLNSGAKQQVEHKCEIGCVADAKMDASGKPITLKGPCKLKCTDPVASGGAGCKAKGQPICATEDNGTYSNVCKMENCNIAGCYADGGSAATANCAPGKMTKNCDGACYDKNKWPTCKDDCAAVCGVKEIKLANGKTQLVGSSYRNACIAAAEGAKINDCTNISMNASSICSASLYNNKGCCDGVEYNIIHPLCAVQTVTGKPDLWVTFRNQGEFTCLTQNDPSWIIKYPTACVCECEDTYVPVCGANGFTYTNACQAECFNPPKGSFSWTNGACP